MKDGAVPNAHAKKRGAIIFSGLVVASLLITNVWTNSGHVTPFLVSSGDSLTVAAYRKMAEEGDPGGMHLLGRLYSNGWAGIRKDVVEAHKWLNLAAARTSIENYKEYSDTRAQIAGPMTPQEISEAQRRAWKWLSEFEKRAQ